MIIGIPRALLYYRYKDLWRFFFTYLGCQLIFSPKTNKEILENGKRVLIDESCLAMKIYMGHINYLIGKCDYILIPNLECIESKSEVCPNFTVLDDLVNNIFNTKLLSYDIKKESKQRKSFLKTGVKLGFKRKKVKEAYKKAKKVIEQPIIKNTNNMKILLVGHPYNIYDEYIGGPLVKLLNKLNIDIIYAHSKGDNYKKISKSLSWTFNQELVNGIVENSDKVAGIILLSVFPCGPDSLVNEVIKKSIEKPIIELIIDEQNSFVALETRIESFIDILRGKSYENN